LHFGETDNWKTQRKVNVRLDSELANAVARARLLFPRASTAAIVHELAVRGAAAIERPEAAGISARNRSS